MKGMSWLTWAVALGRHWSCQCMNLNYYGMDRGPHNYYVARGKKWNGARPTPPRARENKGARPSDV